MKKSTELEARRAVNNFLNTYRSFDKELVANNESRLKQLTKKQLPLQESTLIKWHEALLFTMAYPASNAIFEEAEKCLIGLVQTVKKEVKKNPHFLYNSGISGSLVCAQFGLWLNQYLLAENLDTLYLESVNADESDLVAKLSYTLDDVEQELMGSDLAYFADWQQAFYGGIKSKQAQLRYLIAASMQSAGSISYRENMFAAFQLFTTFSLDVSLCGLSLGRAPSETTFIHANGLQKQGNLQAVFALGKPQQIMVSAKDKAKLVRVARGAMASLLRETDTFTYAQTKETAYFDMGEGITIALYFMEAEQKFSLQSYIGFMLFKNGLPMAYGGCWLLAGQAAFGVNVLPPYRGGESSKVVAQLLRLYHFTFQVSQFTVDPYQIGKGNAEGIESGAFWFYYKLGFRPVDKRLQVLASKEFEKMCKQKNYRSSLNTMLKLVDKDLVWHLNKEATNGIELNTIATKIAKHVSRNFAGNRHLAREAAKLKINKYLPEPISKTNFFNRLLICMDAFGVFEKLSVSELQKVVEAYQLKVSNELLAFQQLQGIAGLWYLFKKHK